MLLLHFLLNMTAVLQHYYGSRGHLNTNARRARTHTALKHTVQIQNGNQTQLLSHLFQGLLAHSAAAPSYPFVVNTADEL